MKIKSEKLINKSLYRNKQTDIDLCFYNPTQTLIALKNNIKIKKWHHYILFEYIPVKTEILLLFPCAASKPWTEGVTKSRNYQILYKLLSELKIREDISLHTISEPLGIIGESDYINMPAYDNPGLFFWFVKEHRLKWDQQDYNECINILGILIGEFLIKFHNKFKRIVAFVKPNSNHEKMVRIAKDFSNLNIKIGPTKTELGTITNGYIWMDNKKIKDLIIKYLN